jgi:hypothetical protein
MEVLGNQLEHMLRIIGITVGKLVDEVQYGCGHGRATGEIHMNPSRCYKSPPAIVT